MYLLLFTWRVIAEFSVMRNLIEKFRVIRDWYYPFYHPLGRAPRQLVIRFCTMPGNEQQKQTPRISSSSLVCSPSFLPFFALENLFTRMFMQQGICVTEFWIRTARYMQNIYNVRASKIWKARHRWTGTALENIGRFGNGMKPPGPGYLKPGL